MSATDERHRGVAPPPAPPPATEPAHGMSLRAADAEREATVARLHQALGDGYLDLDETDQRVAAAYAARLRSELVPLVADLPRPTGSEAPTWAEVWTSALWRARVTILGETPEEPTAEQCRTATLLVALVVLWLIVCAFLGAVL